MSMIIQRNNKEFQHLVCKKTIVLRYSKQSLKAVNTYHQTLHVVYDVNYYLENCQ